MSAGHHDDDDFESPDTTAARLASDAVRMALWPVKQGVAATGDLAGRAGLAIVDVVIASPYTERAVDRVLKSSLAEHTVEQVVTGPLVEAALRDLAEHGSIARLVESPETERLVGQVVARLLESEELWLLVDEIAQSPAVTEAITQQGLGFADEINQRTRRADASTERVARRLLRRHVRVEPPPPAVDAS